MCFLVGALCYNMLRKIDSIRNSISVNAIHVSCCEVWAEIKGRKKIMIGRLLTETQHVKISLPNQILSLAL